MQKTSYPRKPYTRKPATPQQQLERALQIAHEKGLKVAYAGPNFWVVPSDSEALKGLYHVVTRQGQRLHCECMWAQQGRICAHRATVYEYLKQVAVTVHPASSIRPLADAQVAQAVQPTVIVAAPGSKLPPVTAHEQTRKRPVAQPAPTEDRWGAYQDVRMDEGIYAPVAARANRDRYGDSAEYVPGDYASHQYR